MGFVELMGFENLEDHRCGQYCRFASSCFLDSTIVKCWLTQSKFQKPEKQPSEASLLAATAASAADGFKEAGKPDL